MFKILYENALKANGMKPLSNVQLNQLFDDNKAFLNAKYRAIADEISYRFDVTKFEPEILSLTIEVELVAANSKYLLTDLDVLRDTILIDFIVPLSENPRECMSGLNTAAIATYKGAYLLLCNDQQQKMVDHETLIDYMRDGAYWETKGKFKQARLDWKQSGIIFPNTTLPTASAGDVIECVVKYIDMKRDRKLFSLPKD